MSVFSSMFLKNGISLQNRGIKANGPIIAHGGIIGGMGIGNVYFLDPTNGSDSRNGKSPQDAFASLGYAYTKLTADRNDVLVYIPGTTSISLTEELEWAKDYTHFIGISAPVELNTRCRIFATAGAAYDTAFASKSLLKVTATGCIFKNLYLSQGADGTSQYYGALWVTGSRNYFENIHAAGMAATSSGGAAAHASSFSAKIEGAENTFERCTFGVDTITRTADNAQIIITGSAQRLIFRDCRVLSAAETAGYFLVRLASGFTDGRFIEFRNTIFQNFWTNHVNKLTNCIDDSAGATHDLIIDPGCMIVGITGWANNLTQIWVQQGYAAATSGIGINPAA